VLRLQPYTTMHNDSFFCIYISWHSELAIWSHPFHNTSLQQLCSDHLVYDSSGLYYYILQLKTCHNSQSHVKSVELQIEH
jgi:hypothetical protein